MKIDKKICDLVSEIEYQIGKSCYNPNSVNGYSGEEGLEYRYPVEYKKNKKDKDMRKTKYKLEDLTSDQVASLRYVFGTNHLLVGDAIINTLKLIESRYGIDFNELEEQRLNRRKANMKTLSKEMNTDGETELYAGKYLCGTDFEAGRYLFMCDDSTLLSLYPSDGGIKFTSLEPGRFHYLELKKGDVFQCEKMLLVKSVETRNDSSPASIGRKANVDKLEKWICGNVDANSLSDPALDLALVFLDRYPKKLIKNIVEQLYGIDIEYVSSASSSKCNKVSIHYNE